MAEHRPTAAIVRSRTRAMEAGLPERIIQEGPRLWAVPSRSVPGDAYAVTLTRLGTLTCSCPAGLHGAPTCVHRQAVALLLEAVAAPTTQRGG